MLKKFYEDEEISVMTANLDISQQNLLENVSKHFKSIIQDLKDFYRVKSIDKINMYFFSKKEDYAEFVRERDGEAASYSTGGFDANEIYVVMGTTLKPSNITTSTAHELAHVFYYRLFDKCNEDNRVVWFDEGLVYNLSGQMSALKRDNERFRKWFYHKVANVAKIIPDMQYLLKHGSHFGEFCDNETFRYNGYDISYVTVRYLMETMSDEEFRKLFGNKELLIAQGNRFMCEAVEYYKRQLPVKNNIDEVSTPKELLDYMDMWIAYGWEDKNGNIHYNNLKDVKELYHTIPVRHVINICHGTCLEQAMLIRWKLQDMGYNTRMFSLRDMNPSEKVKMHFVVLFEDNNKWYYFEHSNYSFYGIHEFDTFDEAVEEAKNDFAEFTEDMDLDFKEVDEIPEGLSFAELNDYLDKIEEIKKTI